MGSAQSRMVARAIVIKDGHLLVNHRHRANSEYYALPGGMIEPDETSSQAAAREVLEETSLVVKPLRLVYSYHSKTWGEQDFWLCEFVSGDKPMLQTDAPEYEDHHRGQNRFLPGWFTPEELKTVDLYPLELKQELLSSVVRGEFPAEPKDVKAA